MQLINHYIHGMWANVQKKLNKGHERSVKAKKNILASVFVRGASVLVSFLLVPLTIDYVNTSQYGVWLTLSSIVGWFSFFDIGLTHGLRNKFAEAKASGDNDAAQAYVSTTYGILALIFCGIWLVFLGVNQFLDWRALLNLPDEVGGEISILALIVFTYFCIQFVLRVVTTVLTADQHPAAASLIDFLGQLLSLLIVVVLVVTTSGSLINLGLALCVSPILVLLGANLFLFSGKYKDFRPVLSKVRLKWAKGLFNLGAVFFAIQIASIIQFQSSNIIIARSFEMTDVTTYNIVYKYFSIINMVFVIFSSPLWSASTEAYVNNDYAWIRGTIKKYNLLTIGLLLLGIIMLLVASPAIDLWLGEDTVEVSFALAFWALVYFGTLVFGETYTIFLNGISALRIQFISSVITPFAYIALVLFFINNLKMGLYAVFVASIIANCYGFIIAPIQYRMIVVKRKKGVWIK